MPEPIKFSLFSEAEAPENLKSKIAPNENIVCCFRTARDVAAFTNKRILIGEKLGLTNSKSEYITIPYKNIIMYTVITAGVLDIDAEIRIVLLGGIILELSFVKGSAMPQMLRKAYDALTQYVLE